MSKTRDAHYFGEKIKELIEDCKTSGYSLSSLYQVFVSMEDFADINRYNGWDNYETWAVNL